MKYYDSMGFESENGIWVRRVDVAALEAENERLLSQVCQWSESCTGRHGSQEQCVTLETKGEST